MNIKNLSFIASVSILTYCAYLVNGGNYIQAILVLTGLISFLLFAILIALVDKK